MTEQYPEQTIGLYMNRMNFIFIFQFSTIGRIIVQKTDLVIFVVFLVKRVFFFNKKNSGRGKGIIFITGFIGSWAVLLCVFFGDDFTKKI